jgi:hypothetical protein
MMPRKHILIESQSSLLPGLIANLSVLAHWFRKSLKPMVIAFSTYQFGYKRYCKLSYIKALISLNLSLLTVGWTLSFLELHICLF